MSDIDTPDWLPDLIELEDFSGDWQRYEDEVYAKFYTDFVESKPIFQSMPVYIKRELVKGKERGFWHCIQEGKVEKERTPNLRRCERITWIRALIENADDPLIKKWPKRKKGKIRFSIWLEEADYLVILEKRSNCWILWTAFYTDWPHTRKKLRKEYEESHK